MAKKRYSSSEASIQKWIKEGRGSGRGRAYKPWLTVRDCPSQGRSHRVFGHKSQRTHHFLSDLELAVFLLLEWHADTEEIREQFPLRLEETMQLAKDAGIEHPSMNGVNQVMSSDFLVNSRDVSCEKFVLQAKCVADFSNPRTIEKLELERRYWMKKSVPWMIITDQDIPRAVFDNINWLYPVQRDEIEQVELSERVAFYHYHFSEMKNRSIIEVAKALDVAYELEPGFSLLEIRRLLSRRCFIFDITVPFRKLSSSDLILGDMPAIAEVSHVSNQ